MPASMPLITAGETARNHWPSLQQAGDELDEPGEQHDDADHLEAELLDELPDEHREAGGRAAHLQRRARRSSRR